MDKMGYLVRISFLGYNLKSYPDYHKISYNILSYPIISFNILRGELPDDAGCRRTSPSFKKTKVT